MQTRRTTLSLGLIAAATLLSGLCYGTPAFAKPDARETALRSAEQARFAAQVSADAKALAALLDDGLEYAHSSGTVDTKASLLESLASGKLDYVSMEFQIESLRIFGNVAVIRGKAQATVSDAAGKRDLNLGYTDVWLWKDQRWQMTSWRSAKLP